MYCLLGVRIEDNYWLRHLIKKTIIIWELICINQLWSEWTGTFGWFYHWSVKIIYARVLPWTIWSYQELFNSCGNPQGLSNIIVCGAYLILPFTFFVSLFNFRNANSVILFEFLICISLVLLNLFRCFFVPTLRFITSSFTSFWNRSILCTVG